VHPTEAELEYRWLLPAQVTTGWLLSECPAYPQVALNSERDYDGGRLVFATEEGLVVPSRFWVERLGFRV
jgi:hypothetical protein